MANYAAGSALYYADNRLYISVLTTSASKLSYVDLTADIFWPISIGQISAAPVALYSAMQNAAAGDADGPASPGSAVSAERKGDFLL